MRETIIQFGEGVFLRGFVDHFVDVLNKQGIYDGKVVVIQPGPAEKSSRCRIRAVNTISSSGVSGMERRFPNIALLNPSPAAWILTRVLKTSLRWRNSRICVL